VSGSAHALSQGAAHCGTRLPASLPLSSKRWRAEHGGSYSVHERTALHAAWLACARTSEQ
jgi:hypothetical protein